MLPTGLRAGIWGVTRVDRHLPGLGHGTESSAALSEQHRPERDVVFKAVQRYDHDRAAKLVVADVAERAIEVAAVGDRLGV